MRLNSRRLARRPAARQAGFSFVEVLFALGVFATVLLAIATLIYIGQRNVNSGRKRTVAVSVATDAMEELKELGYHQTYQLFGHDGSATSFQTPTGAYKASVLDGGGPPLAMAEPWLQRMHDVLGAESELRFRFESLTETGTAPVLSAAAAIRVDVIVLWNEGPAARNFVLSSARS